MNKLKPIPKELLAYEATPEDLLALADKEQKRRGIGEGPDQFGSDDAARFLVGQAYASFAQQAYLSCQADKQSCLVEAREKGKKAAAQYLLSYKQGSTPIPLEPSYASGKTIQELREARGLKGANIDAAIAPSWCSSTPGKVTIAAGVVGLGALAVTALVRR